MLLIGAGGFARETLELVRAVNRLSGTWEGLGLLDDEARIHGHRIHAVEVIGSSDAVHDHPDALDTTCVASPDDPPRWLALVSRLDWGQTGSCERSLRPGTFLDQIADNPTGVDPQ